MPFNRLLKKIVCISSEKQKAYSLAEAEAVQLKLFKYLIRRGKFTAFGEHYQFKAMLDSGNLVSWFTGTVPIHTYSDMYVRWWYRLLNGETYVVWPGKQKYFLTKVDENKITGRSIPVSRAMISSLCYAGKQYLSAFRKDAFSDKEELRDVGLQLDFNKIYYSGTLAGIVAHHKPLKYHCCFNKLFAPDLLNNDVGFLLSEVGWLGSKVDVKTDAYRLMVDNGIYFEFLPYKGGVISAEGKINNNHATTLTLSQLSNNVEYLLVVTNNSGAWRYVSGYVISFIDTESLKFVIKKQLKTGK